MTPLRQFGEWATALRTDPFKWARLRLTFSYLAIITIIVIILSSSVYSFHALAVRSTVLHYTERFELRPPRDFGGLPQITVIPSLTRSVETTFYDYLDDLRRAIIIGDIITIIVAGALSYLLAGRTLRPIKQMLERQSRFFANATHDLRTPLAVMTTEDEVALRRRAIDDRAAREIIASNLEELRRMAKMVEQMRILSSAQSGKNVARPAPREELDLRAIVQTAVAKMSRRAEELGVRLAADSLEEARIRCNRDSFERALYNVMENSLSYTPRGGEVAVFVRRTGSHVEVSVKDSGIGISEKDLPHVTEPFYRADEARGSSTGGSGLGLTIVADLVAAQGGTLHLESELGKGTTVSMRFHAG